MIVRATSSTGHPARAAAPYVCAVQGCDIRKSGISASSACPMPTACNSATKARRSASPVPSPGPQQPAITKSSTRTLKACGAPRAGGDHFVLGQGVGDLAAWRRVVPGFRDGRLGNRRHYRATADHHDKLGAATRPRSPSRMCRARRSGPARPMCCAQGSGCRREPHSTSRPAASACKAGRSTYGGCSARSATSRPRSKSPRPDFELAQCMRWYQSHVGILVLAPRRLAATW
jgi:hypothetical protein